MLKKGRIELRNSSMLPVTLMNTPRVYLVLRILECLCMLEESRSLRQHLDISKGFSKSCADNIFSVWRSLQRYFVFKVFSCIANSALNRLVHARKTLSDS